MSAAFTAALILIWRVISSDRREREIPLESLFSEISRDSSFRSALLGLMTFVFLATYRHRSSDTRMMGPSLEHWHRLSSPRVKAWPGQIRCYGPDRVRGPTKGINDRRRRPGRFLGYGDRLNCLDGLVAGELPPQNISRCRHDQPNNDRIGYLGGKRDINVGPDQAQTPDCQSPSNY